MEESGCTASDHLRVVMIPENRATVDWLSGSIDGAHDVMTKLIQTVFSHWNGMRENRPDDSFGARRRSQTAHVAKEITIVG